MATKRIPVNQLAAAVGFAVAILAVSSLASADVPPRVFLLDGAHLHSAKQQLDAGADPYDSALAALQREANKQLKAGPFSVVNKGPTPPSGDKRDYMSRGPYWWPDPKKPDGLPYIRRDGQRNPEINQISDRSEMSQMSRSVETLALAYYFTGNRPYARQAARLLRAWFLDPTTGMNPHFEFAQAVPGRNTGRGIGLIESVSLTRVVDAVGLLAGSPEWSAEDQAALEAWFREFLDWMLASKHGRDEARARNNHGTYYDVQVAAFALFVGDEKRARRVLSEAATRRIAAQIEPDGRQPHELARTRSWSYSVMNLRGMMSLARLGEHVGVDLWGFRGDDGRGIQAALDFLVPFATGEEPWPYEQLDGFSAESLLPLLRTAASHYPDERYRMLAAPLGERPSPAWDVLLFR